MDAEMTWIAPPEFERLMHDMGWVKGATGLWWSTCRPIRAER